MRKVYTASGLNREQYVQVVRLSSHARGRTLIDLVNKFISVSGETYDSSHCRHYWPVDNNNNNNNHHHLHLHLHLHHHQFQLAFVSFSCLISGRWTVVIDLFIYHCSTGVNLTYEHYETGRNI